MFFASEVIAYGLIAYAYATQMRKMATDDLNLAPAAVVSYVLRYHPLLEVVPFFILIYVTYQTIINYLQKKHTGPLLVSIGFILITLSHLFFFFSSIFSLVYIFGHLVQLIGFLTLLTMLLRVASRK